MIIKRQLESGTSRGNAAARRNRLRAATLGCDCPARRAGTYSTRAEKLREGDKQVNDEDEEFAHGVNATTTGILCQTARHRRIPSYCEFATDRLALKAWGSGIQTSANAGNRRALRARF